MQTPNFEHKKIHPEDLEFLRRHKPLVIGMSSSRKAAICIPLIETETGFDILYQVRSSNIDRQPGDICFPGGMSEEGETTQQTAVREMSEELLVRPEQIEVLGLMDLFCARDRLYIYPYAVLLRDYNGTFSTDEVEEVFRVPVSFFLENEPERYEIRAQIIQSDDFPLDRVYGGKQYSWRQQREKILFYQYGRYTIWGMTAAITESFVGILKEGGIESGRPC